MCRAAATADAKPSAAAAAAFSAAPFTSTAPPVSRTSTDLIFSEAVSYTVGFRQSKTALFGWNCFSLDSCGPSYRQSSRFYSFCGLSRGGWCGGVICCIAVENRLAALRFTRSSRATRA